MNQLVALQVRSPDFDASRIVDKVQQQQLRAEQLENAQMDNQLSGMKLEEATGLHNAETQFRERSAAGDPNADEALSGYPEMQKKIWDAFDGMSPKDYKAAKIKAMRFGEAARSVLMFPEGTPEQKQAWDVEIGKLAQDGLIPEDQAAALIKSGPNPLIIDQALTVEEFAKQHGPKGRLDKQKAQTAAERERRILENTEADNERADENQEIARERLDLAREKADTAAERIRATLKQKQTDSEGRSDREDEKLAFNIEKEVRQYRKDLKIDDDPDMETDEPEKYKRLNDRAEAFRARLLKQFGFTPDGRRTRKRALGGDKVEAAEGDTGGDGSSVQSAARPASKADYDALPSGAYFINPADGKLKRKP